VFLGTGSGTFKQLPDVDVETVALAVADLNGDAWPDLLTRGLGGGVTITQGNGDGTFGIRERFAAGTAGWGIWVADLNRDGRPEVLLGGSDEGRLTVLLNRPEVFIETPNQTGDWGIGTTQIIGWRHRLPVGTAFRVEVSRDGGVRWETVADAVRAQSRSTKLRWVVSGPPTSTARIRVTALGTTSGVDVSNADLTLRAPYIRLLARGPLEWALGSTQRLRWRHNLAARTPVAIELSRDGGASWTLLADDVLQTGSTTSAFTWRVTGPGTQRALVRVTSTLLPGVFDVSPSPITIAPGFIQVLAPQAGAVWPECARIN